MQGKLLNIPSYVEDPHYRYKMPRLQLKIEGKGNGIKTNIVNLQDAAKALRVPTEYPLKFLGHELGSQTIYKEKGKDVTSIINGSFKEDDIKNMLDKFIEKYVLCPNCKYPEMSMKVKAGKISGQCNACGTKPELDNTHKLAPFIVKNPPKIKWDIKKDEAKGKFDKEVVGKKDNGDAKQNDSLSEEEKSPEKNDEKVFNGKVALNRGAELTIGSQFINDYAVAFTKEYQELSKDKASFEDDTEIVKKLLTKICSFDIPSNCRDRMSFIIFSGVFTINIAKEISKNSPLIKALFENLNIQNTEEHMISNLEHFVYETHKDVELEKYISTFMKLFYDDDLLTEDFLLSWHESTPDSMKDSFIYNAENDKKTKELALPFVNWLKSAAEQD